MKWLGRIVFAGLFTLLGAWAVIYVVVSLGGEGILETTAGGAVALAAMAVGFVVLLRGMD